MAATTTLADISDSINSQGIDLEPQHGILTLHGYGIKVSVDRGHLIIEDGIGAERSKARFPRVGHRLKRLIVIGADGMVSLAALRWLADQNASFVMLNRDGSVLFTTGPVRSSDARLRRAQALASHTGADVVIARELIHQKLLGQEQVAREHLHVTSTVEQIAACRLDLAEAETLDAVRTLESRGAAAYWSAWRDVQVTFPVNDLRDVPKHWRTFGTRKSILTGSQRLATNPPNAILNYLYAILEAESRLAAAALGLDPGLGFIHVDTTARDSLACDLMEAIRPKVDAYVLRVLRETLSRKYFFEERNGNCRLMADFAAQLAETAPMWAREVAPFAEWVASFLWGTTQVSVRQQSVPTRLTQRRRSEGRGNEYKPRHAAMPQPQRICRKCGGDIHPKSTICKTCNRAEAKEQMMDVARLGRVLAQSAGAQLRRGNANRRHTLAASRWKPSDNPAWLNEKTFRKRTATAPILRSDLKRSSP